MNLNQVVYLISCLGYLEFVLTYLNKASSLSHNPITTRRGCSAERTGGAQGSPSGFPDITKSVSDFVHLCFTHLPYTGSGRRREPLRGASPRLRFDSSGLPSPALSYTVATQPISSDHPRLLLRSASQPLVRPPPPGSTTPWDPPLFGIRRGFLPPPVQPEGR